MKKMNPKIKTKWLKALRSNEYDQGIARLLRVVHLEEEERHEFCCLGVLCDLYARETKGKAGFVFETEDYSTIGVFYDTKKDCSTNNLTSEIRKWANLSDKDEIKLMNLNDQEEYSFKQIADWIKDNL